MRIAHCAVVLALFATVSCGGDDDSSSSDAGSTQPTESVATTEVEPAEARGAGGVVFSVTQADDGCTLTGPDTVPAGATYFVVVANPSEDRVDLYVSLLADGHTYQEFADLQEAPGKIFPKPSYIVYASSKPEAATEFNETADLAEDESGYAYSSEPGPHAVYTWISTTDAFWLCGSFEAT